MQNETKNVYAYNADGKYTQTLILNHTDRSQNSGVWQIPAQCTETTPLAAKKGYDRIFKEDVWSYVEMPKEDDPVPPEPEQPPQQPYEYADPAVVALALAVAAQEERLSVLEGGAKE